MIQIYIAFYLRHATILTKLTSTQHWTSADKGHKGLIGLLRCFPLLQHVCNYLEGVALLLKAPHIIAQVTFTDEYCANVRKYFSQATLTLLLEDFLCANL